MTEEEARAWITGRYPHATGPLEHYVGLLVAEASRQNLIAPSTMDELWSRHIVDSAQLIALAPGPHRTWLDVGTGAGLPGIVVALITGAPVELVEPRKRRVAFLADVVEALEIRNARLVAAPIERADGPPSAIITARAVASLGKLFEVTAHRRSSQTVYLLPKGQSAPAEVDAARASWQGLFHVEQSITRANSYIVIARNVASCTG